MNGSTELMNVTISSRQCVITYVCVVMCTNLRGRCSIAGNCFFLKKITF